MIVRAAQPEEYREVYALVDAAFKSPLERRILQVTLREDPHFQPSDLRVVSVDGHVASMMLLLRRPLRVGRAMVNGAIVAPVATHPNHQRKGYCSAVMRDAVAYMKTQEVDLSILWGAPWLYPRYGYSPAMVRTELVVKPTQPPAATTDSCSVRPLAEMDLEAVTQMYHANTATQTCAEVRSPAQWEWQPNSAAVVQEVVTDETGTVVGYWSQGTDWGRPCAHEVGVATTEACGVVFNRLLEAAKTKGVTELPCLLHPTHPFTRYAFHHGSEVRIRSGGGAGMARVINLQSLLTAMAPELDQRLRCSELHDLKSTLTIMSEDTVVLHIDQGQVSVAEDASGEGFQLNLPLSLLNPLITGYLDSDEVLRRPHVAVTGGNPARRLIEVLFPARCPSGGFLPLVWE